MNKKLRSVGSTDDGIRDDVKELRISSDHGAVLRLSAQGTVGADRVRD